MIIEDVKKDNIKRSISIINTLFVYICTVSLINVVLLTAGFFYPLLSLVLSLLLLLIIYTVFKVKIIFKDNRFNWLFLLVIVISLFLRFSPNLYLTGGQDQGSYVSLSKQYEVNHNLYIKDELRESLSDDMKKMYDKGNMFLGLDLKDKNTSEYVMPFYPVFPSWMSIFGTLFGSDNRIYALTMFSILSIVGVYLLTYEMTDRNKKMALLASFLVGINPLHVYFSRMPVTEIVSLTFLLFSLYFLARFYNSYKEKGINIVYLALSLLAANALFYTRMSALFFLPIIILIPILSEIFNKDRRLTKYLVSYLIIWIVFLALSYLYYYRCLPNLFDLIIGKRILNFVDTKDIVIFLVSLFVIVWFSSYIKKVREFGRKLVSFLFKYLFVIALIVFVGLIVYQLYFYVKDIFIDNGYSLLSFESLSAFKQLSVITTFLYVTPFGFVLIPISFIYFGKKGGIKISLLITTILIFLISNWWISRVTQYHYYYARYQLSELIPFCLILLSIFFVSISKKKIWKIFSICIVIFMSMYFGYFSVIQLRDYEGADRSKFEEIDEMIEERDLLIVAKNDFESFDQIVFPLKYYYNINTFPIYYFSYIDSPLVKAEKKKYENVYILTALSNLDIDSLELVKVIDFKHNYLVHCNRDNDNYFLMESSSQDIPFCKYIIIPNRYYHGSYQMYLYKWK
ncbi:MAG: hypothetical protein AB9915_00790 [Candidatus Dojkabacteria bacterium]